MSNAHNRKYFEFMKYFFNDPLTIGSIRLFQIGEGSLVDGGQITTHVQECHEISLCMSGSGCFGVNGEMLDIRQGDVHIIPKGSIHEITANCPEGFRFSYLGFEFVDNGNDSQFKDLADFYESNYGITKDNGDISVLFRILINEWYNEPKHSDLIIESVTASILVLVERLFKHGGGNRYNPQKNHETIGRSVYDIIQYVDNNILSITGVRMVADKFGYTENYVSHMFKNKTGHSILQYITTAKLRIAAEMLTDSYASISEISERLNYSSPQAFSKMFRKQTGFTPTQYRAANKAKKLKFEE